MKRRRSIKQGNSVTVRGDTFKIEVTGKKNPTITYFEGDNAKLEIQIQRNPQRIVLTTFKDFKDVQAVRTHSTGSIINTG